MITTEIEQVPFRRASRLAAVSVSEILQIEARASQLRREGQEVVVLAAGEPDFDTPDHVKEAAIRAMHNGQTKYTTLTGTVELREAIREKFRRDNQLDYGLDEICVTVGAKQALHNAFLATLDPGDEVVVAAPYWTSYASIIALAGGITVPVQGAEAHGFRIVAEDLEAVITPRTRWVLLNSPSNPSGAAYTAEQLGPLLDVVRRHPQVWVMSDDIYEHLLYDGRMFATAAAVAPDLRSRILVINGVSKAYAMTGWRLGFAAGPRELIRAMTAVQSQSTSSASSISQAAAVAALVGPQDLVAERCGIFQRRRDRLVARLNQIPGLSCAIPGGAFYVFPRCSDLLGRETPQGGSLQTDSDFCRYLLDEYCVAVVPGSCFGLAGYFRISYAASEDDLAIACERIAQACSALC